MKGFLGPQLLFKSLLGMHAFSGLSQLKQDKTSSCLLSQLSSNLASTPRGNEILLLNYYFKVSTTLLLFSPSHFFPLKQDFM